MAVDIPCGNDTRALDRNVPMSGAYAAPASVICSVPHSRVLHKLPSVVNDIGIGCGFW